MDSFLFNACTTTGIVCRPNCPPGRRTKPEHRRYFKTLGDARQNGYRECLVCKPSDGPKGPWQSVKDRRQKIGNSFSMSTSLINNSNQISKGHNISKVDRNKTKSNLNELSDYTAKNTDLEEDLFTC